MIKSITFALFAVFAFSLTIHAGIYDPLHDTSAKILSPSNSEQWSGSYMWYPGQQAAFLQQNLLKESKARCVNVGYPGKFLTPVCSAMFKTDVNLKQQTEIRWAAPGKVSVSIDNKPVSGSSALLPKGKSHITVTVNTDSILPCLIIDGIDTDWLVSTDGMRWTLPESDTRYNSPDSRPDMPEEIQVELTPKSIVELAKGITLVDFFHLELGNLRLHAKGKGFVNIRVGETPEEAISTNLKGFEQKAIEPFTVGTEGTVINAPRRALRYALIEHPGIEIDSITFTAYVWQNEYLMDFKSDDPELNELFDMSRATMHTSTHGFYLDGIKRDFLPWAMDAVVASFAGDYLFGDRQTSRNGISISLMPLNPQKKDYGVVDYPLHAIYGIKQYVNRYGDYTILEQYKDRIIDLMELYMTIADERHFISGNIGSGFIPGWDTKNGPDGRGLASYPQIMLYGAYNIVAGYARTVWKDKKLADKYTATARNLQNNIMKEFWDENRKTFVNGVYRNGKPDNRISHHAQYWAILTGLFPEQHIDNLFANILPNIPYYYDDISYEKGYEMLAYSKAGKVKEMWNYLSRTFGDWKAKGHSRFPENLSPNAPRDSQLVFYGRPYGLSLCHGANGAPIVVGILNGIIGFSQSETLPSTYMFNPELLHLNYIQASIPVKEGVISLNLNREGKSTITIPSDCRIRICGKTFNKKGTYSFSLCKH